jgi:hypothetical protein
LRKIMVVLAIALALGGSAPSTAAFAMGSAFGGGHRASGRYAYHSDRVSNLHHGLLHSHGRGYEWDPWGHWGAYYGPMITVP